MTRKTHGGKGDSRRTENRAAVEANWPTNWNARESAQAPVLNGQVERGTQGAVGEGAAVQDVQPDGEGSSSDHL